MILEVARSHLVVIDLQTRLTPAIDGIDALLANASILLKAAQRLGAPVTLTEQYPKGLGATVPEIAALIGEHARVIEKINFSALRETAFRGQLDAQRFAGRDQVIIFGAEAHVCVLQTAIEIARDGSMDGVEVYLVADATGSRRAESKQIAIDRMRAAGVVPVTTEMVLFEWLGRAGTETFRALSPLIR